MTELTSVRFKNACAAMTDMKEVMEIFNPEIRAVYQMEETQYCFCFEDQTFTVVDAGTLYAQACSCMGCTIGYFLRMEEIYPEHSDFFNLTLNALGLGERAKMVRKGISSAASPTSAHQDLDRFLLMNGYLIAGLKYAQKVLPSDL